MTRKDASPASGSRKRKARAVPIVTDAFMAKVNDKIAKLQKNTRKAVQLTAADYATTINCTTIPPAPTPKRKARAGTARSEPRRQPDEFRDCAPPRSRHSYPTFLPPRWERCLRRKSCASSPPTPSTRWPPVLAVPPAFTEWIGLKLMARIATEATA
jgi:hypothetical protein